MDKEDKPILIIDSNVIIKHQDLDNLNLKYNIMTVPNVISEIRDPKARETLRGLTFDLKTKMPERQAIDFVLNFSKKTGDYVSISAVDGQVIALAVDNIMKKGKGDLLRNEPKDVVECIGGKIIDRVAGDDKRDNKKKKGPALIEDSDDDVDIGDEMINKALEVNDEEEGKIVETLKKIVENEKLEDGNGVTEVEEVDEKLEKVEEVVEKVEEVEEENCEELTELEEKLENMKLEGEGVKEEPQEEEEEKPINPNLWAENKDYDTDDEDGWINPDNFDYLVLGKEELEKVETLKDIGVFIMTSDFAMQVPY